MHDDNDECDGHCLNQQLYPGTREAHMPETYLALCRPRGIECGRQMAYRRHRSLRVSWTLLLAMASGRGAGKVLRRRD